MAGIVITPHKKAAGAPFTPGSADNGLCVDPVTGKIVLGNDNTFAFGDTAQLLSSREIYLAGFSLNFLSDPAGVQGQVQIDNQTLFTMDFSTSNAIRIQTSPTRAGIELIGISTDPFIAFLTAAANRDFLLTNVLGTLQATDSTGAFRFLSLDEVNQTYQIGDINKKSSGMAVNVDAGSQRIDLGDINGTQRVAQFQLNNFIVQLGDIDSIGAGLIAKVDGSAQRLDLSNTALTAAYSVNGNPGASGSFTTVDLKTVTVEGGIITLII